MELWGSNATKEKNRTCTPCVEGLSCPMGSTVDMLLSAESMVQTQLVEGPKGYSVFEIDEHLKSTPPTPSCASIHFVPQAALLAKTVGSIQVGNRAMDTWSISFRGFYRIKPLHNSIDDMVKHHLSASPFLFWGPLSETDDSDSRVRGPRNSEGNPCTKYLV